MKLIIGGFAQGKLEYAKSTILNKESCVFEACLPEIKDIEKTKGGQIIINHLNLWIKESLKQGKSPEDIEKNIFEILEEFKDITLISDEIGSGVVPLEEFERKYRETTGRLLIKIAKKAEAVERVICGIGQKIK